VAKADRSTTRTSIYDGPQTTDELRHHGSPLCYRGLRMETSLRTPCGAWHRWIVTDDAHRDRRLQPCLDPRGPLLMGPDACPDPPPDGPKRPRVRGAKTSAFRQASRRQKGQNVREAAERPQNWVSPGATRVAGPVRLCFWRGQPPNKAPASFQRRVGRFNCRAAVSVTKRPRARQALPAQRPKSSASRTGLRRQIRQKRPQYGTAIDTNK
jgi:hypothetical protein